MLDISMVQPAAKVTDTTARTAGNPTDDNRTRDNAADGFEAEYSSGREQRNEKLPSAGADCEAPEADRRNSDVSAQEKSDAPVVIAVKEPSSDAVTVDDISAYAPLPPADGEIADQSEAAGVMPSASPVDAKTAPAASAEPDRRGEQLAGLAAQQKPVQATVAAAGLMPGAEDAPLADAEPQRTLSARNSTAETVITSNAAALSKSEATHAAPAASTPDTTRTEKAAMPANSIAAQAVSAVTAPGKHPGQASSGHNPSKTDSLRDLPLRSSPQASVRSAMAPNSKPTVFGAQAFVQMKLTVQQDKLELSPVFSGDLESAAAWELRAGTANATGSLAQTLARAETPAAIGRQMAEALQKLPDRPVELSLNPRELGRVRMSIAAAEGGIMVSVVVERPETLDLMRRNIDQLAREFQSIGYETINFSFAEGHSRENRQTETGFDDRVASTSIDLEHAETNVAVPRPKDIITTGLDLRL